MYGHKQRAVQEVYGFALCVHDRKYRFFRYFYNAEAMEKI